MASVGALDIKELQILLHLPEDAEGFYWHHRILIRRVGAAIWVLFTPDGDLEVDTDRFISLGDKGVAEVPGEIVWVQSVKRSEVEQWKRQLLLGPKTTAFSLWSSSTTAATPLFATASRNSPRKLTTTDTLPKVLGSAASTCSR